MPQPAATKTRAVAYLRVSTVEQAEQGVSLDAQRAKVEAYAALYDLELVAVEIDAGVSAKGYRGGLEKTLARRPGLDRALGLLRAGEADALLVVKLDRLTRSVRDLGALVEHYFASRWALVSVSEQIDTRSAAGRLVLNVLASVAQWEREATGERTSAALAHKRARGEYTGGRVPYGWTLADDGVRLRPVASEQQAISVARDLRANGLSLRRVGRELAERGLTPRTGRHWHAKTVRDLLRAEVA